MQIHNFSAATLYAAPRAQRPFVANSCPNLETFRAVNGGDFCTLPDGHNPCHPGFRPYRCADGSIVGVQE